eukprot:4048871-Alexandrium_andersonii.AAC.1
MSASLVGSEMCIRDRATAAPSARSSTVWYPPAAAWTYRCPSSRGGRRPCPTSLRPQAVAAPSVRSST